MLSSKTTSRIGSLFVLAELSACGRSATPPPIAQPETVTVAGEGAARPLVVVPSPTPTVELSRWRPARGFADIGEGRRGSVVGGRRVVLTGEKVTTIDGKAVADLGQGHRVPTALGGGWIFVGTKTIYFGKTYDGALGLVATDVAPNPLGVGHDGILVRSASGATVFHRLSTGRTDALPIPNAENLFGLATGQVAAQTKSGELYVSTKSGAPFLKVATPGSVVALGYDGTGIVVHTKSGAQRLGAGGKLTPRGAEPGMVTGDNLVAWTDPWPDMSRPPPRGSDLDRMLEPLTIAFGDKAILAVRDDDLVVLDPATGRTVSTQHGAFAGHQNCFPIRGGSPAFIGCNDGAAMALFRIEHVEEAPVLERSFKGVYSQDFGEPPATAPLVVAKRCDGSDVRGAFCVRRDAKTWTDVPPPADPDRVLPSVPMIVHALASADGAPYAFGWQNGNGDLVIVDGRAKKVRRVVKTGMPAWAQRGIRWNGVTASDGELRFLIPGARPGVLVVRADDAIQAQELSGKMSAVGAKALLVTAEGQVRETLDAGRTFHDVGAPPTAIGAESVNCVEGGCTVGPWHRVGWGP